MIFFCYLWPLGNDILQNWHSNRKLGKYKFCFINSFYLYRTITGNDAQYMYFSDMRSWLSWVFLVCCFLSLENMRTVGYGGCTSGLCDSSKMPRMTSRWAIYWYHCHFLVSRHVICVWYSGYPPRLWLSVRKYWICWSLWSSRYCLHRAAFLCHQGYGYQKVMWTRKTETKNVFFQWCCQK